MESSTQRSYPPQQHVDGSLDDSTEYSRTRDPLADATGNRQNQEAFGSNGPSHYDIKANQHRDPPQHVLPSQPSRQTLGNTLELRRQGLRRHRSNRLGSLNPIVNSPQYIAYRNRQAREGNELDAKWPAMLEEAFLEALLRIPKMGRRKFSMNGKPYGRNELISEYLWIAYKRSLPPGAVPDQSMRRARKQVSSHIQVLKGFMKGHPAADRLFSKTVPENGFEDSFKHDPVLIALQHGRIWNPHSADDQSAHVSRMAVQSHMTTKPIVFWLLITKSQVPEDISGRYTSEQDLYRDRKVVHKYTGLNPQPRSREYLDNIPNWRERFPPLAQAISINELSTEIIHMDVSLELMRDYAPGGAELFTRMEMTIPGHGLQGHQWQTVTSLFKPQELYYADLRHDPPLDGKKFIVDALEVNDVGARIKVPFPPNAWAHALTRLTDIQHAQAESRKSQILEGGTHSTSAREYIEQISMYQEVQSAAHCYSCTQRQINRGYNSASRCSCGKGAFLTRAIILWTFHKARHGEQGSTTWRYVDAFPPRRMVMSPSPHPTHHVQASMSEHFNSWAETPMQLHQQNILDPFSQVQGLVTPPATAGLQSPFASGFVYQNQNAFDLHQENVSFISHGTVDSESTLVEENTVASIDSFLSNSNVNLGDLDNHANGWHMPHSESFDAQPSWAYNVPTTMPQLGWENEKVHAWPEVTPARQASWSEASPTKPSHVWPGSTPTKQVGWNSEGSLTKLASWSEDVSEKHEQQPEQLWDVLPTQIATKQDQRFVTEEAERKAYTWMAQPTVVDGDGDRESKNEIHNFVEVTGQEEKIPPLPELGSGNASGTGAKAWSTCDEAFVMVRNDEAFGYNGHE